MGLPMRLRKQILSLGLILACVFFIILPICRVQKLRHLVGNSEQDVTEFGAIQNSTLGFQKILVLGLPARFDKRDVWSLATRVSEVEIEWINGVRGEDITEKARPAGWDPQWDNNTLGSLRGHMNAMRRIIDNRLSTALILEDDVEWDVMIRQQLLQFAHGARYVQEVAEASSLHSPYGDDWDLLLFGHCAARSRTDTDSRYWVAHEDPTVVPTSKYEWVFVKEPLGPDTSPPELQGNFTRLIYEPGRVRCPYSYAMSLRGAERFIYHFSVEPNARMLDDAVNAFCTYPEFGGRCITVFPNLIDQYRPAGPMIKDSDRRDGGARNSQVREHGTSLNIVFPVKAGLRSYVDSSEFYDSAWPEDSLWPWINPITDRLPIGEGYIVTKDKFRGYD